MSTYGTDWNSDGALNVQIFQLSKPTLSKAGFNVKHNATHLLAQELHKGFPFDRTGIAFHLYLHCIQVVLPTYTPASKKTPIKTITNAHLLNVDFVY